MQVKILFHSSRDQCYKIPLTMGDNYYHYLYAGQNYIPPKQGPMLYNVYQVTLCDNYHHYLYAGQNCIPL